MICSQCRGEIPAGARFCPSCGQPTSSPDDERRVVTVLFADIVGFTTLSETMDPERVKRLVDSWFERLVGDITDFGGRVDKIVGDGILALFGAPVAHEDDAERAVRAALRMQATLASMAGRATAGPGPKVQMRIGVNTGEVLVGAMRADGVITAMGDVVNTASRLQTAARPGEVLLGPTTHTLTVHAIASERRGLLTARGRDAPVEAWSAVRALLPPGQRPDRHQMPLVGRTRELGLIDAGVAAALGHHRAFLGVVVGDTGVGKSRLVREAAERIGAGSEILRLEGRCVPYGEANVWWPLAEALQSLCEVEPEDELPRVRDAVWARVAAALGDDASEEELDRVTAGLLVLMGHEATRGRQDPADAKDEAVDAFASFLEGHLRRRPVVLQLSDIHWADDDLLTLVEVLLTRLARCPLVVLATARQAVRERWSPPPGRHDVVLINLDPLDDGPAGELLVALHGGEVPAATRDDLLARSGGNPFFLEELVALMDSSEPGASPRLPDTLRGIVTARLDALTPGERDVLTDAAVIGRRGPVSALREMAAEMGRDVDVDEVVATLAANELLDVEDRHWEFRSEMAREVAYATLTKAVRTTRHAGIAAWLEARALEGTGLDLDQPGTGPADTLAGLADLDDSTVNRIAHHWAAAAELSAEMGEGLAEEGHLIDHAVAWLSASARRAQRRDLLPAAERAYDRALALAGPRPVARRTRLLVSRSRVRSDGWDLPGAREDAEAALAGAAADGDRGIEAAAVLRLGDIDQRSGDTTAAIARLRHAADRFTTEGDERGRGEALRLLGMAQMFAGQLDEAVASIEEAGAAFERAGDRSGQGWAQQNRAWVAMMSGDLDTTEAAVGRAVALFAGVDDTVGRAWAMGLLAFVRFAQGRREEAETLATSILAEATVNGDRWAVAMMRGLVGSLRLWSGRVADALEETAFASQGFRDLGDPWGLAVSLATHGRALAMSGQVDEGFAAIASSDTGPPGGHPSDVVTTATLALAVQVGEPERAGRLGEDAAPHAGGTMGQTEGDVTFALAQLQCGRVIEVPEADGRAYGLAASALVAAAAGRGDDALARAAAVEDCPEATYLDRALAHVAAGMAEVATGRGEAGLARLDEAAALVEATDDLVGRAMVALARAVAAEVAGAPTAVEARSAAAIAVARLGLTSHGWETAFALAAGSRPHASVG